jgi:ribulose 1,5-bisphosphate synthetase/thiazole synthase
MGEKCVNSEHFSPIILKWLKFSDFISLELISLFNDFSQEESNLNCIRMIHYIQKAKKGISLILITIFFHGISTHLSASNVGTEYLYQSKREIPIAKTVDVVVIGGTSSAVAAAVAAAEKGAKVYLVAPRLYLGEDMCATLRLTIDADRELKTSMEKQIFGDSRQTTPLTVKATLNTALLDANVEFVFGSLVTDILYAKSGDLAGVVIANRAGRQAILAGAVIDATDRGWVSRMAGASADVWTGEEIEFERIVVMQGENDETPEYILHKLSIKMPDLQFSSFARAEQIAREQTYTEEQLRASESLFHIPPDPIICKKNAKDWKNSIDLDFFQPKGFKNLFVLSGSAGIPRSVAASLLQPAALAETGSLIGAAAADMAKSKGVVKDIKFRSITATITKGNAGENLAGLRPVDQELASVTCPESGVPVLAQYDVVVVGGGTSGAPAAIAAARLGMKVLVVEFQEGLGGVGTLGFIGKPYHGRKVGFAAEVPFPLGNIEPKMEWYRSEIAKYSGDIWLGVLGSGAYVEGNKVTGAIISTPQGRGVVQAKVIIDATGSGDIAIAAGSEYMYGDIEKNDIALQGTGLPSRPLKGNYINTDYLMVDESDMLDVWRTLVSVQQTKFSENDYDAGSLIQNRERRRIIGDYELSYLDQVIGRTFPDAIVLSGSDYDSHGYPSASFFALLPHDEVSRKENHPAPGGTCYTPYRSLLPKNLEGILVTGLGISMDRDASAMIRMQLDLANQGYAAGTAATYAIKDDIPLRDIDIKKLQEYLVTIGNLPETGRFFSIVF